MRDKVVVTERTGGKVTDTLRTSGDAVLAGVPTIVLVNGGSASASEILAGALSDNNAAKLVGEKTFGKGVVQDVKQLGDGGSLKVTIASWYTPNGKNISKEGITPQTVVTLILPPGATHKKTRRWNYFVDPKTMYNYQLTVHNELSFFSDRVSRIDARTRMCLRVVKNVNS
jgi:C-terminal peptidase prc